MSKTGLSLCALYAAVILGCIGYAALGSLDEKSRFVLLQLPIALQAALADRLGLSAILQDVSWVTAYIIFGGPIFMLLYLFGFSYDAVRRTGARRT